MAKGPFHRPSPIDEPYRSESKAGPESGHINGLTCIHQRTHCVATHDPDDCENELDQIDIQNFLDTLAEVALAVARRGKRVDP